MAVDKLVVGKKYHQGTYIYTVLAVGKRQVFCAYVSKKADSEGEFVCGIKAALNEWYEYVPPKMTRRMYASIIIPLTPEVEPWVFNARLFTTKGEIQDAMNIVTVTWEENADENN